MNIDVETKNLFIERICEGILRKLRCNFNQNTFIEMTVSMSVLSSCTTYHLLKSGYGH